LESRNPAAGLHVGAHCAVSEGDRRGLAELLGLAKYLLSREEQTDTVVGMLDVIRWQLAAAYSIDESEVMGR
jgi:hypothetical protein